MMIVVETVKAKFHYDS